MLRHGQLFVYTGTKSQTEAITPGIYTKAISPYFLNILQVRIPTSVPVRAHIL